MTAGNGHTQIDDFVDDLLAELERMAVLIADLRVRVDQLQRSHDAQRRVRAAASRGGLARAKACREDPRREQAKLALEDLAKQNARLSLTRRCELVGAELGVSGRTIQRWTK